MLIEFFLLRSTANRYLLRFMAKAGAGASEVFDSKAKSKWERKVNKTQQLFVTGLLVYLVIWYLKLISSFLCLLVFVLAVVFFSFKLGTAKPASHSKVNLREFSKLNFRWSRNYQKLSSLASHQWKLLGNSMIQAPVLQFKPRPIYSPPLVVRGKWFMASWITARRYLGH